MKSLKWIGCFVLGTLLCAAGVQADGSSRLGQLSLVADEGGAEIGDVQELSSPAVVRTAARAAVIELSNGRTVQVRPFSTVELESGSGEEVRVAVHRGQVAVEDARGRAMKAGVNSFFVLQRGLLVPVGVTARPVAKRPADHSPRTERPSRYERGESHDSREDLRPD